MAISMFRGILCELLQARERRLTSRANTDATAFPSSARHFPFYIASSHSRVGFWGAYLRGPLCASQADNLCAECISAVRGTRWWYLRGPEWERHLPNFDSEQLLQESKGKPAPHTHTDVIIYYVYTRYMCMYIYIYIYIHMYLVYT